MDRPVQGRLLGDAARAGHPVRGLSRKLRRSSSHRRLCDVEPSLLRPVATCNRLSTCDRASPFPSGGHPSSVTGHDGDERVHRGRSVVRGRGPPGLLRLDARSERFARRDDDADADVRSMSLASAHEELVSGWPRARPRPVFDALGCPRPLCSPSSDGPRVRLTIVFGPTRATRAPSEARDGYHPSASWRAGGQAGNPPGREAPSQLPASRLPPPPLPHSRTRKRALSI
jgi:hypothetical protein